MKTHNTYILLKMECSKEIPDVTDKVAGRAYTLPGVENTTATLMQGESLAVILQLEAKKARREAREAA